MFFAAAVCSRSRGLKPRISGIGVSSQNSHMLHWYHWGGERRRPRGLINRTRGLSGRCGWVIRRLRTAAREILHPDSLEIHRTYKSYDVDRCNRSIETVSVRGPFGDQPHAPGAAETTHDGGHLLNGRRRRPSPAARVDGMLPRQRMRNASGCQRPPAEQQDFVARSPVARIRPT
jgi:hypothetical protein